MARVSIVIKALNEELNIRRAIESSLAALANHDGEVIVADSASTDQTIEIAKQFPVSIVQLERTGDRSCGVGPQLGYQHCNGEYVYILDGDMELKAPFLERAIGILDREPAVAGVGGYIHEMRADNLEVQGRIQRFNRMRPRDLLDVDCLNGGGLYRRSAIADVGYLSDRNLHAFEEYDLGARLRVKGWRLLFLEDKAVDHFGYALGTWPLLWHRLRSGRFISPGELLRAAIDGHYVRRVVREVRILLLATGVWLYWGLVLLVSHWVSGAATPLIALAAPVIVMAVRTRSLRLGIFSVLIWHINAVGFLVGFLRRRRPPSARIDSKVLQNGAKRGPLANGPKRENEARLSPG
ncbi:MAG: glycosyltransferase family 2 protein [Acidobacteriota bacterium]|nr:glycosyltransferase family 2 protein [Acidobacteriota bacterium]